MSDRRRPGPAPGAIRPGSLTDRARAYAADKKAFGYAEIKVALLVKRSKDIAAASVLVCVIAAVLLGAITLWPYLI